MEPKPLRQQITNTKAIVNLHNETTMNEAINTYNEKQTTEDKAICNLLAQTIEGELTNAVSKIGQQE